MSPTDMMTSFFISTLAVFSRSFSSSRHPCTSPMTKTLLSPMSSYVSVLCFDLFTSARILSSMSVVIVDVRVRSGQGRAVHFFLSDAQTIIMKSEKNVQQLLREAEEMKKRTLMTLLEVITQLQGIRQGCFICWITLQNFF